MTTSTNRRKYRRSVYQLLAGLRAKRGAPGASPESYAYCRDACMRLLRALSSNT